MYSLRRSRFTSCFSLACALPALCVFSSAHCVWGDCFAALRGGGGEGRYEAELANTRAALEEAHRQIALVSLSFSSTHHTAGERDAHTCRAERNDCRKYLRD